MIHKKFKNVRQYFQEGWSDSLNMAMCEMAMRIAKGPRDLDSVLLRVEHEMLGSIPRNELADEFENDDFMDRFIVNMLNISDIFLESINSSIIDKNGDYDVIVMSPNVLAIVSKD